MGEELRKILANPGNKKIKEALSRTTNKGRLTPTEIVRNIFKKKIFSVKNSQGILFSGSPKMIGEAKLVSKWLRESGRKDSQTMFLYLGIPKVEIVKRITGRKEYYKGKYSKRADDDLKALANRLKYYKTDISTVIKFFDQKYFHKRIRGIGSEKEVFKRIKKAIYEFNN